MRFLTMRDLRGNASKLREDLEAEREVVVTANGRPFAIMTRVDGDSVEEEINAPRSARAQAAVSRIRSKAKVDGLDRLSMDQIDAIIAKSRRERGRCPPTTAGEVTRLTRAGRPPLFAGR